MYCVTCAMEWSEMEPNRLDWIVAEGKRKQEDMYVNARTHTNMYGRIYTYVRSLQPVCEHNAT